MLKVGQIETVEITGYTSEGLGVCRIDGCAVFVPNAIRGEVCEVAVSYVSRNSAQAKIRKLLRVSPHRVNRLCPDAKRCGGCQLHHMDYAEELLFKAQKVTDALNRLGGQSLALVPITGGDGVRQNPAWVAAWDSAPVVAHTCAPASTAPVGAHTVRPQGESVSDQPQQTDSAPIHPTASAPWAHDMRPDETVSPASTAPVGAHTRAPASAAPVGAHTVRPCSPVSLPLEGKVSPQATDEVAPVPGPSSPVSVGAASCARRVDPRPPQDPTEFFRRAEVNPPCGGINAAPLHDSQFSPLNSPFPAACLSYRNKAQYPVQLQNGRPVAGFYKQKTHDVVPIARCAILPPAFDAAKDAVLHWAVENRVPVYDEATGKGLLRHIYVRKGFATGQLMVCIVAAGERLPKPDRLIAALQQAVPGMASVILAVNKKPGNAVLGDEFHTLYGTDEIEDVLCGFRFRLSPRSFYQVNRAQAERLYEKAVAFADLKPDETVLDLYCGTGTITLALSRKAGKAIGVEIIPQAIADAKENAKRNGVENVEFFCADASEAARRFAEHPAPVGAHTRAPASAAPVGAHTVRPQDESVSDRPQPTASAPWAHDMRPDETVSPAASEPVGAHTCAPASAAPFVASSVSLPLEGKVSPQATDEVSSSPVSVGAASCARRVDLRPPQDPTEFVRRAEDSLPCGAMMPQSCHSERSAAESKNPSSAPVGAHTVRPQGESVSDQPQPTAPAPWAHDMRPDETVSPAASAPVGAHTCAPASAAPFVASPVPVGRIDCIVVDPPRKGLAPDVIDAIAEMSPSRVVYVSCDPATLARDVKLLTAKGYELKAAEAVDMFPRTFHVETVCLMSRIKD